MKFAKFWAYEELKLPENKLGLENPNCRFPRDEMEASKFHAWLSKYENLSFGKIAAKYLVTYGNIGREIDPNIEKIVSLHDSYMKNETGELA